MQIHVAGLLRDAVGATRQFSLDADPPLHRGTAELLRTPDSILVRADAEVIIDTVCSRCLAPFGYVERVAFEEEFFQQVDIVTGLRTPSERAEADSFFIGLDYIIDITEAVRQYSEVAAEMQPLCRPDCPGICQECGRDLAIEACACEQQPIDSRWLALTTLKQSRDGQ